MVLQFFSMGSGSSGNCYFVGDGQRGVLVDAGISARKVKAGMAAHNFDITSIDGILITHSHFDHTHHLESLARRYRIPIFTSKGIWKGILKMSNARNIPNDCIRSIEKNMFFQIGEFSIQAFEVSHDAEETLGYVLLKEGKKISIATDLGYISSENAACLKNCDLLIIEANYDEEMLMQGKYPAYLKERIIGKMGHLDNKDTAAFIAEHFKENIPHIRLAHLSKENNSPDKALTTILNSLSNNFDKQIIQDRIKVLSRDSLTPIIEI